MTIIAWDGKSLAVDRMACNASVGLTTTKFKRLLNDEVAAWCGDHEQGLVLAEWYANGRIKSDWPHFQNTKDWSRLVVAGEYGVKEYEKEPVAQSMLDKCQAWGSGGDVALGAMHMGATAGQAVGAASAVCFDCGKGVDVFHFGEQL